MGFLAFFVHPALLQWQLKAFLANKNSSFIHSSTQKAFTENFVQSFGLHVVGSTHEPGPCPLQGLDLEGEG